MTLTRISDADYRRIDAISQSSCTQALSSSGDEFRKRQEEGFIATDRMKLGTLIHAMILEPETVSDRFMKIPKLDRRKTESKVILAEAEDSKKIVIDEQSWQIAESVREEILKEKKSRILFENGISEISCFNLFNDVRVKGKIDYLHKEKRIIVDLKTTEIDLNDDSLDYVLEQKNYKVQSAFYIDLLKKELGDDFTFCFLFVNVKNLSMRKVIVSDQVANDYIDHGRRLYTSGIEKIIKWKSENFYPKSIDSVFIPKAKAWRANK